MYQAMILATWYKKALKESIFNKVYANKSKIQGLTPTRGHVPAGYVSPSRNEPNDVEAIYQQYLKAFKKGAFNYIKEDTDPSTGQTVPRKYFSGGFSLNMAMTSFPDTVFRVIKSSSALSAIGQAAEVKGQAIKVQTMMLWDWLSNPERAPWIIAGAMVLALIIMSSPVALKIWRELRKPAVLTPEEQEEYSLGNIQQEWSGLVAELEDSNKNVRLEARLRIDQFLKKYPTMNRKILPIHFEKSVYPEVRSWGFNKRREYLLRGSGLNSPAKTALITVFMASLLTLPVFQPQAAAQAATGHTIAVAAHSKAKSSKTKTPIPVFKLIPEEEVIKIIEKANGQENFVLDSNLLYSSLTMIDNDTVFKFLWSYRFKENYSPDQKRAMKEGIINFFSTNPGSKLDPGVYTLLYRLMTIGGLHNFSDGFRADFMQQWIDSMRRQNGVKDHSMLTPSAKNQDKAIRKKVDVLVTIKKDYDSATPRKKLGILKDALKITEPDHVHRWAVAELKRTTGSVEARELLLKGSKGEYGLLVEGLAKQALRELNAEDSAMLTVRSDNKHLGGIALNAKMLDLHIKRDGNGVPLALSQQPLDEINIQGFVPQIISIQPVDLPALFGLSS